MVTMHKYPTILSLPDGTDVIIEPTSKSLTITIVTTTKPEDNVPKEINDTRGKTTTNTRLLGGIKPLNHTGL